MVQAMRHVCHIQVLASSLAESSVHQISRSPVSRLDGWNKTRLSWMVDLVQKLAQTLC